MKAKEFLMTILLLLLVSSLSQEEKPGKIHEKPDGGIEAGGHIRAPVQEESFHGRIKKLNLGESCPVQFRHTCPILPCSININL